MGQTELRVRMFGDFTISYGGVEISDSDNRSRKVWLLLAYMIYCRNREIAQDELINLLWENEERSTNPVNALKTMFHRVRTMLSQLGDNVGHTLIIRRGGNYTWNPEVAFSYDVSEFEALCKTARESGESQERLDVCQKALALYRGDFLSKLSDEPWVVPISTYFRNLYLQAVDIAVSLLEEGKRLDDVAALCRKAIAIDPYNEGLYQHLMRAVLGLGDQRGAIQIFEDMSDLLFSNFGIMPSDETKALYREAKRTTNDQAISPATVREQLREGTSAEGALFCDYDFFKVIYHAEAREVARSGDAVHIGLVTVSGLNGAALPKRSLDICMENLQKLICSNLRKGDIAARCSVSQYIMMLPQANYENSCMVMERIIKAFSRQYPHSPAVLRYSVQPLDPHI